MKSGPKCWQISCLHLVLPNPGGYGPKTRRSSSLGGNITSSTSYTISGLGRRYGAAGRVHRVTNNENTDKSTENCHQLGNRLQKLVVSPHHSLVKSLSFHLWDCGGCSRMWSLGLTTQVWILGGRLPSVTQHITHNTKGKRCNLPAPSGEGQPATTGTGQIRINPRARVAFRGKLRLRRDVRTGTLKGPAI